MEINSNLVFRLDVKDFHSKNEIISSIKKILELIENKDFVNSFHSENQEGFKVDIRKGFSFIIDGCNCD
jgi:hypothetical protein